MKKKYIVFENSLPELKLTSTSIKEKGLCSTTYIFEDISEDEMLTFEKYYDYYIIGKDDLTLEKMIVNALFRLGYHVSCAESCTGGAIISRIIGASGASEVVEESYVTYSEKAKSKLLDIPLSYIDKYGVVSEEVAESMAKGLKKRTNSEVCISVTGYAGRDDENFGENEGMCYFCIIVKDYIHLEKYQVKASRNATRELFTTYILHQLLNILKRLF